MLVHTAGSSFDSPPLFILEFGITCKRRPDGLPLYGENLDYNSNETPTFASDSERLHVAFASLQHADRDIALDLLSTNRRLQTDIPVLGTVIVTGPTPDSVQIIIPDCTIPLVGNDVQIDLRHVV